MNNLTFDNEMFVNEKSGVFADYNKMHQHMTAVIFENVDTYLDNETIELLNKVNAGEASTADEDTMLESLHFGTRAYLIGKMNALNFTLMEAADATTALNKKSDARDKTDMLMSVVEQLS